MTAVEILREARALIEDRNRWTRYAFARDERNRPVQTDEPSAVKFCAMGALMRVGRRHSADDCDLASEYFHRATANIVDVNDRAGHADVLAVYDRAIALAEAEAPHAEPRPPGGPPGGP